MNLEHYRNFITIVETGTISGAAEKLHIAQPALSNQIKNLEREYGAPLLTRGSRRVELTDAGRIMYSRAKSIAELENSARREIADCAAGDVIEVAEIVSSKVKSVGYITLKASEIKA